MPLTEVILLLPGGRELDDEMPVEEILTKSCVGGSAMSGSRWRECGGSRYRGGHL